MYAQGIPLFGRVMITNSNTGNQLVKVLDQDDQTIGYVHKGQTLVFDAPQVIVVRVNVDGFTTNEFTVNIATEGNELEFNDASDMTQGWMNTAIRSNGIITAQAPQLPINGMNVAMASGLALWVIPIGGMALLRAAKLGTPGGSSL